MATIATRGGLSDSNSRELSPTLAIKIAWWTWLTLLIAPFVLFVFVVYRLTDDSASAVRDQALANHWFVGTMAYLAVATVSMFFLRSRLFHRYWEGEVVAPRAYLMGMSLVWLALETGGILALVGCLVSNSLLPGMIPAMAAFMFFLPFWPSGHAMVRRNIGNAEDPGRYKEPG